MVEHVERFQEVRHSVDEPSVVESTAVVPPAEAAHHQNVAARVVWYVADLLLALLALRFVLALFGANPANSFADLVYSVSHPFVAPFFSLFNYDLRYGVSRFELFTLVAMGIYALLAFAIARLITINRPASRV